MFIEKLSWSLAMGLLYAAHVLAVTCIAMYYVRDGDINEVG